ncbi:MAG: serine/threonine-protein kinase [Polyangia bacterium]
MWLTDLKPDNVMLVTESDPETGTRERVKLLDFGIAKMSASSQGENKSNTQTDAVLGSPEYMSPEQCKGGVNIDQKADLYSLGVMMYRMLSGRLPFNAEGVGALMAMHIYEKPPDLRPLAPDTPPDLIALVDKMLSKVPAERPTAAQVQYEIEQLATRVGMPMVTSSMQAIRSQIMTAESMPESVRGISTLGGASGQAAVPAPPPKSKAPLFVGLGVGSLVLVGAVVGALSLRKPDKPQAQVVMQQKQPDPPKETPPPPPEPKKRPKWTVDSEPQGADIIRTDDGQLLGQTPWTGEQPDGSGPVEVTIHLTGFSDRKITLKPGPDTSYKQTLKPKRGRKGKAGKNQDQKNDGPEIAD